MHLPLDTVRAMDERLRADPIGALFADLLTDGKPSLTWVTRWSADGREPVAAAWAASTHAPAMNSVLYVVGWTAEVVLRLAARGGDGRRLDDPDFYREVFPVPPTLPQLLEAQALRERGGVPRLPCPPDPLFG